MVIFLKVGRFGHSNMSGKREGWAHAKWQFNDVLETRDPSVKGGCGGGVGGGR